MGRLVLVSLLPEIMGQYKYSIFENFAQSGRFRLSNCHSEDLDLSNRVLVRYLQVFW